MKNYIQIVMAVAVTAIMIVCTIEDICNKRIHTVWIAAFTGLNFFLAWYSKTDWKDMAAGLVMGIVLMVISICTDEKIGKGDAFIVAGMGVYLGFQTVLMIVFAALILVCLYGGIFWRRKKGLAYEVAFIPFLLVPYVPAVLTQLYYSNLSV